MKVLELENYNVYKDKVHLIKNVSFSIDEKDIFCIFGKNGSGKSTLAQSIIGSKKYKISGALRFYGRDIINLNITERAKLGIRLQWQNIPFFEGIKIIDYLKLSTKNVDKIKEILEKLELDPKKYLYRHFDEKLSGGERKKIEIASVICADPKLAIFDEPDSGLDVHSIKNLIEIFKELKEKGTTILLITHRCELAKKIGTKGIVLCNGSIIYSSNNIKEIINFYSSRCCNKKGIEYEKNCFNK